MNYVATANTTAAIDLRSDTVTRPSKGMLNAMAAARVGDDVWGDDPTTNALQEAVADAAGKEAALFFPSGTQSNLAALMSHCGRGDEYIVGQDAHTYKFEGGGAAVLGSIQPQPIENAEDGSLPLDKVRKAVKPINPHYARTRLLALENTIAGRPLTDAYIAAARAFATEAGLGFHLDGARAWNAAVAGGKTIGEICQPFDSVSLCFSKGLGTPIGSVLVGSAELIETAKRWRKVLGGGMRQVGYLAAACRYALDHNVQRLAEDHDNASRLAKALFELFGSAVRYTGTNMIFIDSVDQFSAADFAKHLWTQNIAVAPAATIRIVLHHDVSRTQVDEVIQAAARYRSRAH